MAETKTVRVQLPQWSEGSDPRPDRAKTNAIHQAIENQMVIDVPAGQLKNRPVQGTRGRLFCATDQGSDGRVYYDVVVDAPVRALVRRAEQAATGALHGPVLQLARRHVDDHLVLDCLVDRVRFRPVRAGIGALRPLRELHPHRFCLSHIVTVPCKRLRS